MKTLASIMLYLCFSSTILIAGTKEYNECLLKHLKNTKVDIAAHFIKEACEGNYLNPSFTFKKNKEYNECILKNLPGVRSFRAAIEIRNVCAEKEF